MPTSAGALERGTGPPHDHGIDAVPSRAMNPRSPARRSLALLAVAATFAIGACGGDDDDADPAGETTGATTLDATEPAIETTEAAPATTAGAETTEPATTDSETTEATAGVTYTSPEGDYSAVYPSEPSSQTQAAPLPDGTSIDLVITGVEEGDLFLATARGEYPDTYVLDVPVALQGAQDQAIANVSGTLVDSRDITLQGRPGREFSASVTSNGVAGTVLQQVYLDGLVIYQAIAAGAGELSFDDPELAPFFASFTFTTG